MYHLICHVTSSVTVLEAAICISRVKVKMNDYNVNNRDGTST